ncbi:MAG: alpha/beta hydrolase family esterase [Acidimicrobiales bacterium]
MVSLLVIATLAGPAAAGPASVTAAASTVSTVEITVAGDRRSATVVTPPGAARAPGRRPPLLMVLHGVGMRGADMRSLGFEDLASRRGVIVAYPDAWHGSWNDGRPGLELASPADAVDDVAFLGALVTELGVRVGADTSKVAVVGFSNGALMTGRLACEMADGVVAVGLVAGTIGQGFAPACRPARALPVVVVAGTGDGIVPYGGGQIADSGGRRRGLVASVEEFLTFWRTTDGCAAGAATTAPVPGAAVPVTRMEAPACGPGGSVVHYRVQDGGHDWYRVAGFDTTKVVWGFLCPWFGGPEPNCVGNRGGFRSRTGPVRWWAVVPIQRAAVTSASSRAMRASTDW